MCTRDMYQVYKINYYYYYYYYLFFFLIALGTRFPRAEKLSKLCKKKFKLYGVLQCASIGVLSQIV